MVLPVLEAAEVNLWGKTRDLGNRGAPRAGGCGGEAVASRVLGGGSDQQLLDSLV